jgi:hypothetical protein
MPATSNLLAEAVLARLWEADVIENLDAIRRDHRTVVDRAGAPAVHVIDGDEDPGKAAQGCRCDVTFSFTVSVFVRADAGFAAADPIVCAVMAALDPAVSYGDGIELRRGRISRDQEIADADSLRTDMEFEFRYTTDAWQL